MTATIFVPDFPGNRPSITRTADEPCVVIILPVVFVDRAPRKPRDPRDLARGLRRKRVSIAAESSSAPEWPFSEGEV